MPLLNWLNNHGKRRAKKAREYQQLAIKHKVESARNFEWARNYHVSHPTHKAFVASGNKNLKLSKLCDELARRYAKP